MATVSELFDLQVFFQPNFILKIEQVHQSNFLDIEGIKNLFEGFHSQQVYANTCIAAVFIQEIVQKCPHGWFLWILLKSIYEALEKRLSDLNLQNPSFWVNPVNPLIQNWFTFSHHNWSDIINRMNNLEKIIYSLMEYKQIKKNSNECVQFKLKWNTCFQALLCWAPIYCDDIIDKNFFGLTIPIPFYFGNNFYINQIIFFIKNFFHTLSLSICSKKNQKFILEHSFIDYVSCLKLFADYIVLNYPVDSEGNQTWLMPSLFVCDQAFDRFLNRLLKSNGAVLQQENHMYYLVVEEKNKALLLKLHDPLLQQPLYMNRKAFENFLSRGKSVLLLKMDLN